MSVSSVGLFAAGDANLGARIYLGTRLGANSATSNAAQMSAAIKTTHNHKGIKPIAPTEAQARNPRTIKRNSHFFGRRGRLSGNPSACFIAVPSSCLSSSDTSSHYKDRRSSGSLGVGTISGRGISGGSGSGGGSGCGGGGGSGLGCLQNSEPRLFSMHWPRWNKSVMISWQALRRLLSVL